MLEFAGMAIFNPEGFQYSNEIDPEEYTEEPEPEAPVMVVKAFQGIYRELYAKTYNRHTLVSSLNEYSKAIITDPVISFDAVSIIELQKEGALLSESARIRANQAKDELGSKIFAQKQRTYLKNAGKI